MKTKILILFLTLAIVFGMTGCIELPENEIVVGDFVYYDDYYNGYTFYTVADHAIDKEVFYIPDEVEGQTLTVLGMRNIAPTMLFRLAQKDLLMLPLVVIYMYYHIHIINAFNSVIWGMIAWQPTSRLCSITKTIQTKGTSS